MTRSPRVRYSPLAEAEVVDIAMRIGTEDEAAGRRLIPAAYATAQALAKFPDSGTRVAFGDARLRECRWARVTGFKNYLLVYRNRAEGIEVVRILHGARDLDSLHSE